MTTFEAVCIILNNVYTQIRTKRIVTDPDKLDIRIAYEEAEGFVMQALSDFISSYAEGKYDA